MVSTSARGPRVSRLLGVAPLSHGRLHSPWVPSLSCIYVSYRARQKDNERSGSSPSLRCLNIYIFARMLRSTDGAIFLVIWMAPNLSWLLCFFSLTEVGT